MPDTVQRFAQFVFKYGGSSPDRDQAQADTFGLDALQCIGDISDFLNTLCAARNAKNGNGRSTRRQRVIVGGLAIEFREVGSDRNEYCLVMPWGKPRDLVDRNREDSQI